MPRKPDGQRAAMVLRRIVEALPMRASVAGYLHGWADALHKGRGRRPPR
jgi:hypothetical protein